MTNETKKVDDGGPAFPCEAQHRYSSGNLKYTESLPGMTLRDWFAGKAMEGILSDQRDGSRISCINTNELAAESYLYADAMIRARK